MWCRNEGCENKMTDMPYRSVMLDFGLETSIQTLRFVLTQYKKVICELTHGELSKLTYEADDVIAKIREREQLHAKWVPCDSKKLLYGFVETVPNGGVYCNNCKTGFHKDELRFSSYCPACGAEMNDDE